MVYVYCIVWHNGFAMVAMAQTYSVYRQVLFMTGADWRTDWIVDWMSGKGQSDHCLGFISLV